MTFPELFCNSSHNARQFESDCSVICIKSACNLTQVTTRYASCYTTGIQIWGNAFSFLIFECLFSGTWKATEKKCNNIVKM